MASHATKKEVKEFYKSFKKDEYDLLSDKEWEAFKEGADEVKHFSKAWKKVHHAIIGNEKAQKEKEDRKAQRNHQRTDRHGKKGRDHRPKHQDEAKFLDWIIEEDVMEMVEEWENQVDMDDMVDDAALEDQIDIIFEEYGEIEDIDFAEEMGFEEMVDRPILTASRPRVDMTTRDKMHGGRHLKCKWSGFAGKHGNDVHGRDHHDKMWGGRHSPRHVYHHMKRCILWGAFCFLAVIFAFLVVNKRSLRHRWRYEKMTEVHNTAVERNLNEQQRDELYKQVCYSNCRQRAALRRQMRAQPQEPERPRFAYIPPTEAPVVYVEPMPAPVPPQTF
jgi:hypothetical protein